MRTRTTIKWVLGALAAVGLVAGTSTAGHAESAANIAAEAAKKYSGTTLTVIWEAGLQSLDPLNFSGPMWEKLTGIKIKVVESQINEMFPKMMQEHRAKTGAYDILNAVPAWLGDLVRAGALEPLDAYVDKYKYREELEDIGDVYRLNQMRVGDKIYGFPDDGDVLIMYYRKDVFEDPKNKEEFKAKHGYDLADRKSTRLNSSHIQKSRMPSSA